MKAVGSHQVQAHGSGLAAAHQVESPTQREWLLNVGQRSVIERMAHLLLDSTCASMRGLTTDHSMDFPPTQADLAGAAGVTTVHVNCTLQELRREGLIELSRKQLKDP